MDRHEITAVGCPGVADPCGEATSSSQPSRCAVCLVFIHRIPITQQLKPGDEMAAGRNMASQRIHDLRLGAGSDEDHDVASCDDNIETSKTAVMINESEAVEIALEPLHGRGLLLGRQQHREIQVDARNRHPAPGELDRDASRAAPGVQDGVGSIPHDEVGLAMDIRPRRSQPVEPLVVLGPPWGIVFAPPTRHLWSLPEALSRWASATGRSDDFSAIEDRHNDPRHRSSDVAWVKQPREDGSFRPMSGLWVDPRLRPWLLQSTTQGNVDPPDKLVA